MYNSHNVAGLRAMLGGVGETSIRVEGYGKVRNGNVTDCDGNLRVLLCTLKLIGVNEVGNCRLRKNLLSKASQVCTDKSGGVCPLNQLIIYWRHQQWHEGP